MSKKLKKKPLQKYQEGGDNPFAMFQGSGLDNPFSSGINYNLFGQLQPTSATQQFQNFTADNFGQQIGQAATSTASSLGQIPGFQGTFSAMPEWGGEYAQKMKQDVAKEKGLTYNSWTGKWKNDKGEVYTNKELEDLAGMRYDEQKATKERNQKLAPLAAPLLMLNELGEAQKRSYAQAQKESMYDVSRGPSAMESRGFFAKQGGNVSRLQQMLGYNIPKAQNSLNTGYSWSSPSSQSAAKVAPPSKSSYATNYTEPSSDLKNKPLPKTKEQIIDTFSKTYHGFYPSKGVATIDNSVAQTSIPQTQKESDIQKTYRELEDAINWQKKYINSLDVRDRLINQIGKFNPDKSKGQVIDLVDERINQYKKNLEGIEYRLYNQEDEPEYSGYQDPVNNSVHLSNTLKNPGSVAVHEIRHAFDQLNSKFSDIFESNTRYRVPLDEVRNVQAPYSPGGEFYNEDDPIIKKILVFESSNDPWTRNIIPYYKRFNEKTARMSQLRKRADELGLHKGGANISKEKFNSVIEQLLDDNVAWSELLELMGNKFGGLNKNEIFRLWNETVDTGDNNSYNAQVENNQNPIISAKQGMRTPPVTEVYRMMGAHQGLPETSYKLASALNFKTAKKYEQGAYVKMLDSLLYEDGGGVDGGIKEDSVRNLTEEETNAFNAAKQRLVDYVNSPQWEDRFVKMQIPAADMNKARTKDLNKTIKEDMSIAREAILSNLDKSTPLIVRGQKIQNQAGMFDPDKGYIYINQDFSGPGEIQNVLLHELGHSATDPNTEYVARFVEGVTKSGKEIDPQSMQKFFSSKGKPLTEMDIAYTMEKEIPVLVNTLRGKADEYGILRYGEDFTPDTLNKLLEISNMSTGGTDPAADRDREFLKNQIQYLQSMLKGDENTLLQTLNTIAAADKKGQPMYYNAKNGARVSRLGMLLGSGLIRGYQEGGMQQPMSPEEEQMMMQAMQEQQAMQQPQQQPMPQQGGEMEQEGEGGQNKYMQLPPEQQAEVYKQIIDFILENGIDALEQQFPEEYQFFEEFSDKLEGEDMEEEGEGEQEGGGEMETEAGRMQMGGGEMEEEEMQSEYPTDEQEIPVGARPGENSMRPAQPMPGAQQMKEGGIPERYRNMGYNKVGEKKKSNRPGKTWSVLAKKGDKYKIVHGGAAGMEDFTKHRNEDRKKRFWQRHGGKDSAKARDKFSPLYYAANGFTNAGPTW